MEVMDVLLEEGAVIRVNNAAADKETKVYDNFTLEWSYEKAEKQEEAEEVQNENLFEESDREQNEMSEQTLDRQLPQNAPAQNQDGLSPLERARKRAEEIANAPVTEEVEEEMKKARAYAAAERISAFATAFNQTGQMPVMPARPKMPNITMGAKPVAAEAKTPEIMPADEP